MRSCRDNGMPRVARASRAARGRGQAGRAQRQRCTTVSTIVSTQASNETTNDNASSRSCTTTAPYAAPSPLVSAHMAHVDSAMSRAPLVLRATATICGT
jgi:hypothetical protein